MDRLAEHIVAWHNRHPLARRIALADVHTAGVIALPFYRASALGGGLVEPVLTDEIKPEEIAPPASPEPNDAPPAEAAADEPAAATEAAPPPEPTPAAPPALAAAPAKPGALQALLARFRRSPGDEWPGFDEDLLDGLSPARMARFALAHGFAELPPGGEALPSRQVAAEPALARGGWPYTLYLMSAAVDAGPLRTRVVAGRGNPPRLAGRRLLDPRRMSIAAGVGLALLAGLIWLAWPRTPAAEADGPAPAASAPASAALPASASASEPSSVASAAASAVQQPASSADAASAPPSAAEAASAAPPPDIRPQLVDRGGRETPSLGSTLKDKPAAEDSAGSKPSEAPDATHGAGGKSTAPAQPGRPTKPDEGAPVSSTSPEAQQELKRLGQQGAPAVVALVGPAGSKEDAEAHLKRMREVLAEVDGRPDQLQADVIKTPSGWRATVWPFTTREQAQLVNAFMVARGLKTKAVNF
ncbi:MAG: hypothetical protein DI603_21740 [Roseateles depolymerans]|uniref:SPOR domain-containing protein n=1 Tax=Roseateles depolymerans TaxID=76731 RepID=A0A2W5DA13_9BURK|nr:MAG: hypothetical protein DI603_21740 [Roseateles depolymerans]